MSAGNVGRPLPGWLLDEVASAGRENLDVAHVAHVAHVARYPVDVVPAGFLTDEHMGEPADLVYSGYALHHLL